MLAMLCGLLLVPAADYAGKRIARRALGARAISLGRAGCLRLVDSRIWLARGGSPIVPALLWCIWLTCAVALTLLTYAVPTCGSGVGLLLGGSLSHALETSRRGYICDYVCLRFWPAFNLADAAITVGTFGILLTAMQRL